MDAETNAARVIQRSIRRRQARRRRQQSPGASSSTGAPLPRSALLRSGDDDGDSPIGTSRSAPWAPSIRNEALASNHVLSEPHVVWGEVVDYDIPEVEATEVEDDSDHDGEYGADKTGDDEVALGGTGAVEGETTKKRSKYWTHVAVASAFVGMAAAHHFMGGEIVDEDDIVGVAAIINSGATTSTAAASAAGGTSGGATTTTGGAAAGGGATATGATTTTTGQTFASAVGVGHSQGAASAATQYVLLSLKSLPFVAYDFF